MLEMSSEDNRLRMREDNDIFNTDDENKVLNTSEDTNMSDDDDLITESEDYNINSLPTEMLRVIISYLTFPELSNLMLVSTHWKEITEDPLVWKQFQLSVDEKKMDILENILDIKRLASFQNIKTIGGPSFSACCLTLLFNLIHENSNIKKIDLSNTNVCNVDPDIFSETVNSMEAANLDMNFFTFAQADSAFAKMREKTQLQRLSVKYNALSMVDPFVLAECFTRLKELELNNTYVTSEQVQALFHAVGRQTNLVKLTLVEILVADVGAELFARCAHKLEYLKLTNQNTSCLTQQQMAALFSQAQQLSQLRQIILQSVDLSFLPPQTVASCVNSREKVHISDSSITHEQVKATLGLIDKETKLSELYLDIVNTSNDNGDDITAMAAEVNNRKPRIKLFIKVNTITLFDNIYCSD